MNRQIINYLNRHRGELFNHHEVTGYHKVFWANMETREIYYMSEDEYMMGGTQGRLAADINANDEIVACVPW